MNKRLIIAIDGPAGSGKSTVAKRIAVRLGIPYIDTGAMYRALTLRVLQKRISLTDTRALVRLSKTTSIALQGSHPERQRVLLDGADVTREIRTPELTQKVFYVAQVPKVRREMVRKQRALGERRGAVMEGRDIGTVVFPDADYKFYLTASSSVRAMRRYRELIQTGHSASRREVLADLKRRDKTDLERKEGPLRRAKDAFWVPTTSLTISQVVDKILQIIRTHSAKNPKVSGSFTLNSV